MATFEELMSGDEKLSPDQAQKLAEQWGYKGVSDAYKGMRDATKGAGKGVYTPGKYGVYVGNPMGAFAEGFGGTYSSGMQMAEALRARKDLAGLGSGSEQQSPASYTPPQQTAADLRSAGSGNLDAGESGMTQSVPNTPYARGNAQTFPAKPPTPFSGTQTFDPCTANPNSPECLMQKNTRGY